ncbi:MAG: o-succinylbenzoate synthase [Synechococcales bacterium]|nr:o-succinylbenzoate synthase [Synechococcales bacterium]
MLYELKFQPYQRPFRKPLTTAHGTWSLRQGILLQLHSSSGAIGQGEITPLDWFGSESWAAAIELCHALPSLLHPMEIQAIPNHYPACQFGLGCALEQVQPSEICPPAPDVSDRHSPPIAQLLPSGTAALQSWRSPYAQGTRTFKWKIGVLPLATELDLFRQLITSLPADCQLRLDANAGLTDTEAAQWLQTCDRLRSSTHPGSTYATVEYLEQPLPIAEFPTLLTLQTQYQTPLALDESIATLSQLQTCYQAGWRGIFVIKPAIAGFPWAIRHFCQTHGIDTVFSSVFETAIGWQAGIKLAQECGTVRALGYGTQDWFG